MVCVESRKWTKQKKIHKQHGMRSRSVKFLRDLQVHEDGLIAGEVSGRLHKYGANQLQEAPRPGFWATLWDQLNNFVVILLIVASLISALLGEWIDALAIPVDCHFKIRSWGLSRKAARNRRWRP